jgi:hypothetical protein
VAFSLLPCAMRPKPTKNRMRAIYGAFLFPVST